MGMPDFDRLLTKQLEGQSNPLPVIDRQLSNVVSFGELVPGLRKELEGTDAGAELDKELESLGWL
jgi:hypothetical protein